MRYFGPKPENPPAETPRNPPISTAAAGQLRKTSIPPNLAESTVNFPCSPSESPQQSSSLPYTGTDSTTSSWLSPFPDYFVNTVERVRSISSQIGSRIRRFGGRLASFQNTSPFTGLTYVSDRSDVATPLTSSSLFFQEAPAAPSSHVVTPLTPKRQRTISLDAGSVSKPPPSMIIDPLALESSQSRALRRAEDRRKQRGVFLDLRKRCKGQDPTLLYDDWMIIHERYFK